MTSPLRFLPAWICAAALAVGSLHGQPAAVASNPRLPTPTPTAIPRPAPTLSDVPYGDHPRQVLDFWKAESSRPTPLVFFVHGGGWVNGDKSGAARVGDYLAAGISVVSINYRFTTLAQDAGIRPPVKWPLNDAARALQFVRSKAREWNIDKVRIGGTGGSAGACTVLWLAFHDDMADPSSSDPIARESTRLYCVAPNRGQTTLDPLQMKEWTPNSRYGGHAFGFMRDTKDLKTRDLQFAEFLAARESLLPWIREYSPYAWVSSDDPPVYLYYTTPPALGQEEKDPTHTANFGLKLAGRLREVGVECEFVYPGGPPTAHAQIHEFLIARLSGKR